MMGPSMMPMGPMGMPMPGMMGQQGMRQNGMPFGRY